MEEKMDFRLDLDNGTLGHLQESACSNPRELSNDDIGRILADATRTQDRWGTEWDCRRPRGSEVPSLVEIVRDELPTLNATRASKEKLVSAARQIQAEKDERLRQARLHEFSQTVGQRFAAATLDTYQTTTGEQKAAIVKVKAFAANIRDHANKGEGMVLFGAAGTGKTHLVAAVAKLAIDAGLSVQWTNGQDLFARFRAAIDNDGSEAGIIKSMVGADVLVIDDVLPPGGSLSDYQAACLYRIIDARYRDRKMTLVSLNVANGGEAESGMGAQTADRLRHGALTLFCNWPSYRRAGA